MGKHIGLHYGAAPASYEIAALLLHPGARVNHFEEKAAFVPAPDPYRFATTAGFRPARTGDR